MIIVLLSLCAAWQPVQPVARLRPAQSAPKDDLLEIGKQAKGFYLRPSAAIERGGGFFVPGLEGSKLRIAGGGFLLALVCLNHLSANSDDPALAVSEALAVAAAIALSWPYVLPQKRTAQVAPVVQRSLVIAPREDADELRWAVAAIRQLTPALGIALLDGNRCVLLETSPELCVIPSADVVVREGTATRGSTPALFRLLPPACGAAVAVRCVHRPELLWVVGVASATSVEAADVAWVARLLTPAAPLWGLAAAENK